MFGIVRLLIRACSLGLKNLWPRPYPPASADVRRAHKRKARSEADVRSLLDALPTAKVVRVVDGDTLIVAAGWRQTRIRLDSIDCPEDDQPWGDTATFGLIKLVGGKTVALEEHGVDPHGRTLATLYVRQANSEDWLNVNERMVTLGHAWVMRLYYDHLPTDRQAKLNRLEAWAKSKRVGLWRTPNPIPPWRWRKPSGPARG